MQATPQPQTDGSETMLSIPRTPTAKMVEAAEHPSAILIWERMVAAWLAEQRALIEGGCFR